MSLTPQYGTPRSKCSGGRRAAPRSQSSRRSRWGIVGVEGEPAYVAAKHGIVGHTRAAALEYATRGIRVNALAPGFIATPDLLASPPQEREALAALHPMGRLGEPHEVAEFAAFLLSERAAFITGGVHVIDGGYSAR
ncbi:SDR family NAD(P)-dependent oxidoreductase [Melittangium boletus]|uniref:SDR family NAD(P)-dependent oxidoreductase n=1 Tax=Melittangium boletus TaxID=83453 RepID=UPI003DA4E617